MAVHPRGGSAAGAAAAPMATVDATMTALEASGAGLRVRVRAGAVVTAGAIRSLIALRQVAVVTNGLGVADDEQGAVVYVATGLRDSWAAAWPAFRDYS